MVVEGDIADLVPGFLRNRWNDARCVRELLATGGFRPIGRIGHQMVGSGAAYGFGSITEIGRALEGAAGRRDALGVEAALDHLEAYLASLRLELPDGSILLGVDLSDWVGARVGASRNGTGEPDRDTPGGHPK